MWLVAISLLHDSLHILWLQDLVKFDGLDVVGQPLLKDGEDLLSAALATIHGPAEGLLKLPTELHAGRGLTNVSRNKQVFLLGELQAWRAVAAAAAPCLSTRALNAQAKNVSMPG